MNQEVSITKEQVTERNEYSSRLFPIVRTPWTGKGMLRRNDGMEAEPVEIECTRNLPLL